MAYHRRGLAVAEASMAGGEHAEFGAGEPCSGEQRKRDTAVIGPIALPSLAGWSDSERALPTRHRMEMMVRAVERAI